MICITSHLKVIFSHEDHQDQRTPPPNQSFRLHRINKTGSVRKSSQTFYDPDESFKLAALNSVTRGVKYPLPHAGTPTSVSSPATTCTSCAWSPSSPTRASTTPRTTT